MTDEISDIGDNFVGQILLAMPAMNDPRFERSVIFVCAHNEHGAMGVVINKTLDSIDFPELLGQMDILTNDAAHNIAVHFVGPVEIQRGFVLHSTDYRNNDTLVVDGQISLTATLDVLRDLAQGQGPENFILALGYAGWGPGQLEAEFQDNAWLLVPASCELVFTVANSNKWERAFNSIGIDLSALSGTSGRA